MNISLKSLIVPGVILLLALASWLSYSSYKGEKKRADDAEQSLSLANATITDMQTRQRDVAALDAKYTKELADAKKTISNLRRDVDSGAKRLRVAATCSRVSKTTSATGVDDAGAPELTPDARRNYFDHRDGIEVTKEMINGLHEYINTQCLK
ncbi:TPA: lysis protein [Citrobacter freundii]|nr:lysis protein [Citrobacter freundii]HCL6760243.1 lysis protein [Citrobacter freundii]HED2425077.1 lysis protein [Citrobacter freundii]HED3099552.1 lysis protein [Citrobacter freundii]HED3129711.1 lysis protein [Citrobacter freundii]